MRFCRFSISKSALALEDHSISYWGRITCSFKLGTPYILKLGGGQQPIYASKTPPLTLANEEFAFKFGECILVRISEPIEINGNIADEATTGTGTDLPPTSNGKSPQYLAFIRRATFQPEDGSYLVEAYPVVSFTFAFYNTLDDATKAILLPLPPLSHRYPQATPEAFGAPLEFGGWSTRRDSWLRVIPSRFVLPWTRPFKRMDPPLIMPRRILEQIELYREHLGLNQNPLPLNGILALEGVDEDAQGPDATALDDLRLMAHDDPKWRKEVEKHLREEEMQRERAERLASWRESIT